MAGPTGGYLPGEVVASFIGFAPAYSPRLAIAVVVTRPRGSHYGAVVAAPVFREIAEKVLWYLKVPAESPARETPDRDTNVNRKQIV
jgi:cell division protein FtsI/penicillin-binding protein 2